MGMRHLNNLTPKDLAKAGVTQREYDAMKKLMIMDPEIFIDKHFVITHGPTPFIYTVDLSKYENEKIP